MIAAAPKRTTTLADRQDVVAFLATLPSDAERERLAKTYRARAAQLAALKARDRRIRVRLAAIAETLPDAGGKDRTALIAERAGVYAELAALPDDVAAVARRYAEALIAWASYVYRQTVAEGNAATTQVDANATERIRLDRAVTRLDESTRNVAANPAAAEQVRQEHHDLMTKEAPHRRRRREAEIALAAITAVLRGHFGDQVRRADVSTHLVERYVEQQRRAAR